MMDLEYEDNVMQLKKKKLNTIRFIGELFKKGNSLSNSLFI
jgi:hypothetical protein